MTLLELTALELAMTQAREHGGVAVKVAVPGLEVGTVSYARLSARNLKRLLDCGRPLVGLGSPPAGAAPIRLTAEAEATVGAPAWFDVEALERLSEPLYREPTRHAVRRNER